MYLRTSSVSGVFLGKKLIFQLHILFNYSKTKFATNWQTKIMWYDQYCNNDIELLPNTNVYTHVHVPIFLQFLCDRLNKVYQQSLIAIEENIDTGNTIQDSTAIRLGLKKLRKYINTHCMITRWEQVLFSIFSLQKAQNKKVHIL